MNYCLIPEEFKLKNVLKKSALTEFMRKSKTSPGIHFSIVAPKNLDLLTDDYFQKFPPEFIANINEQERHYIDDIILQKKQCLLPDLIIRDSHDFEQQPLTQVKHPRTGKMGKTIHNSVLVGTDLKGAATKFRCAVDQQEFFDDGKEWVEGLQGNHRRQPHCRSCHHHHHWLR